MTRLNAHRAAVAVLAALVLTACGGSAPARTTNEPVVTAPAGSPTVSPTAPSGSPVASVPSDGAVAAPEVVAAVGQDRAQTAAETAERFAGVAMSNCGQAADTLAGLEDLLTPDAYAEAKTKPGGVVLEIQANLPAQCVLSTAVTVTLTLDGPTVIATADVDQRMTALRDGQPAPLNVQRTYTMRMQPTGDSGWVVTALTTSDPQITAAG